MQNKLLILMSSIFFFFFLSGSILGADKVVYKYKEYEKFDLGDLEIKGSIVAPGDITVKERRRKVFNRDLYHRENFDKELIFEIKTLR